jgi:hypothetical protein
MGVHHIELDPVLHKPASQVVIRVELNQDEPPSEPLEDLDPANLGH